MQNKRNGMRTILFTLALALMLAAFSGCSARLTNPVVGKVGNENIYYQTYYSIYTNNMYMGLMYGTYDVSTDEKYRAFQDSVFDSIIDSMLPVHFAKENGVTLTDEEEADVQANLEQQLDSVMSSYETNVDASITDEAERKAAAEEEMAADLDAMGITYDEYVADLENSLRDEALGAKYLDSLLAEVTVTDADIEAYYDEQVAYYQMRYAEDAGNYYTDYSDYRDTGAPQPLFIPEGYSYYKHILITNPEEGEEKDVDAIVAEVYAKIEAGEDFDALIEQYGGDPGMQAEPYKTEGYILSEANADSFYAEFSEAALALENEGDITAEAVESTSGKHIIKKLGPVESRTIPLDEVKEDLRALVQTEKEDELYESYLEQWRSEITIKKYYSRVSGLR